MRKLTDAQRCGLDALAAVYPGPARVSNVTDVELGYVYWQTARTLMALGLASSFYSGPPEYAEYIELTPRGVDVVNGGRQCRACGCTDNDACEEGCSWVEADLCSACVPEPVVE